MNVISSFTRTIGTIFDTLTQGFIALNHLARGAAERTVVVEEKSIAAAAISQLRNQFDVARNVQDLYKSNAELSQDAIDEGRAFLNQYKAERKLQETPDVVTMFREKAKQKAKASKTEGEPFVPGVA